MEIDVFGQSKKAISENIRLEKARNKASNVFNGYFNLLVFWQRRASAQIRKHPA